MPAAVTNRALLLLLCGLGSAHAQQVGTVGMHDATVQGALEVRNGQAILVSNTTITALDHPAEIALNRGGTVRICATSGLHVTAGKGAAAQPPLMLALDRGAVEIKMPATSSDVIMTPDLRFTARGDGSLDLQLRVTRNGDTCVENRGPQSPTLNVADQFGEASYELRPGQHVLFEHGSLKEVVDHETSSCGCPPEPTMSVADALLHPGTPGSSPAPAPTSAAKPEDPHPFPAAVSEGLAPATLPTPPPPGTVHSQVSATLSSNDTPDSSTVLPPAKGATPAVTPTTPATTVSPAETTAPTTAAPPANPPQKGVFHAVGRFFRRIFGGS